MKNLLLIYIMLISTIGPSIVIAVAGVRSLQGIARNPYAAPKILLAMLMCFLFGESIAVISLFTIWNLANIQTVVLIFITLISTLGPSLVIAFVGGASIQALARNPFAAGKIMISMLFAFLFAEAVSVISLLTVWNLAR